MNKPIHKAHKIALVPTDAQARMLAQNCGFARRAYNDAVARFKAGLALAPPQWLGLKDLSAAHTQDKQRPDNQWMLQDCIAVAGFNGVRHAADAVRRWGAYRKSLKAGKPGRFVGFPRFHSRAGHWSFTITNGAVFLNYRDDPPAIKIPKIGWVRMREALRFSGDVHTVTISRSRNRWFVSFALDTLTPIPPPGSKDGPIIAAHPGVRVLLTESTATHPIKTPPPKALDASLCSIQKLDKAIARSKPGSKNRRRLHTLRRKYFGRVTDIRHDAQHKASRALVGRAGTIRLEQWDSAGLLEKRDAGLPRRVHRRLHRDFADAAPASLVHKITYKAEWDGVLIEKFRPAYPSSIQCSACGWINDPTPEETFRCTNCGHIKCREENATENMLQDSPP